MSAGPKAAVDPSAVLWVRLSAPFSDRALYLGVVASPEYCSHAVLVEEHQGTMLNSQDVGVDLLKAGRKGKNGRTLCLLDGFALLHVGIEPDSPPRHA